MDWEEFEAVKSAVSSIWEVSEGLVLIDLSLREGFVEVDSIWSEAERGVGHAGSAMRELCILADCRGIELRLCPHWLAYDIDAMEAEGEVDDAEIDFRDRLNSKRLTNAQLEDWYGRLGFSRTGSFEGDDPVMARPPAPAILYHSAPRSARDGIETEGLLVSASEAAELARESGAPDWKQAGAVFLSSKPEGSDRVDVWAVQASGLAIVPDDTTRCPNPGESWWKLCDDVPADRLSLHSQAQPSSTP